MSKLTIFKSPVPVGMQVYEYGVEVAGVCRRFNAARKFVKRSKRRLYLECVADSGQESRAIRVIGRSRGWLFERNKCIGYVPGDIANKLMHSGMEDKVTTRLQFISIDDKKSLEIRFDILGSKDDYRKYAS